MSEEKSAKAVPPEPIQVLKTFLAAADRKDEAGMKACLSRRTLESGTFNSAGPEDVRFVLGDATWEGDMVVIPMRGFPKAAPAAPDAAPAMELACLMVQEDGRWKFDLSASVERMMGGSLETVVGQLTSAMAGAMEGIGKAMAEGLSQAFGPGTPPAGETAELPPGEPAKPLDATGPKAPRPKRPRKP